MNKVKLIMPTFVTSSGPGNNLQMISPKLVVGDKVFKVKRTDFNYGNFMEVTIMINANDLDIISADND